MQHAKKNRTSLDALLCIAVDTFILLENTVNITFLSERARNIVYI